MHLQLYIEISDLKEKIRSYTREYQGILKSDFIDKEMPF